MAKKIGFPAFQPPMLATLVRALPDGPEWEYEVKLDGYRLEAIKQGDNVRLYSRRGNDFTKKFSRIATSVARIKENSFILDGEAVAVDKQGRPSFQMLQNRSSLPPGWSLVYCAFDLLQLDGNDLKGLPLQERRFLLEKVVRGAGVLLSQSLPGTLSRIIQAVKLHGLEGVIAKKLDSKYRAGERSKSWLKQPLKPGHFDCGPCRNTLTHGSAPKHLVKNSFMKTIIMLATSLVCLAFNLHAAEPTAITRAVAVLHPTAGQQCRGVVRFTQGDESLKVVADLEGLAPGQKHAFHIHQYGDCSAPDAMSAGGHYNPEGHQHGLPDGENRHAGDLGNVQADDQGKAHCEITVTNISIVGLKNPIIGRAVIVHAKVDDGSQPVGNAGGRIACGVIGIAK